MMDGTKNRKYFDLFFVKKFPDAHVKNSYLLFLHNIETMLI